MKTALLCLCVGVVGCAGGLDKARGVVTSAVKTEGDVEDGILAAVKAEQKMLIAKVQSGEMSPDQAQAAYDVWREKVSRVVSALTVLHDALKVAAHSIDMAEALGGQDYSSAVADVISAAMALKQVLADAGVQ